MVVAKTSWAVAGQRENGSQIMTAALAAASTRNAAGSRRLTRRA
jgi:hypothetical protein